MFREVVLNLLRNLGGRAEVDRYLAEYDEGRGCTVVKVGGGLVKDQLDELSSALALLHHVGMRPVVVHGAGAQLTAALREEGLESEWVEGLRVTRAETLAVALRVFQRVGGELAGAIGALGVGARPIVSGVFRARTARRGELGLVGEIEEVEGAPVEQALATGCLPILAPVGTTADGQLLNVNADHAARAMAAWRRSRKVLFLTPTGGILDERQRIIPAVNCELDLDELIESGRVKGGMARKLLEIKDLLEDLDAAASVSITAPAKVARELFTYRGSGTLVRRGTAMRHFRGPKGLDRQRLHKLLERSFGRSLDPDYVDTLEGADVHVGGDYTAVAVVRAREHGDYLDKLGIGAEAQGIGLGALMWNRLRASHPRLYWRSRPDNPVNKWYLPRSDGMHRSPDWLVFWYGIEGRDAIEACVADALSFPTSFVAPPERASA
jgi:bifunctional N-acetylglutamate synthase/kinase